MRTQNNTKKCISKSKINSVRRSTKYFISYYNNKLHMLTSTKAKINSNIFKYVVTFLNNSIKDIYKKTFPINQIFSFIHLILVLLDNTNLT